MYHIHLDRRRAIKVINYSARKKRPAKGREAVQVIALILRRIAGDKRETKSRGFCKGAGSGMARAIVASKGKGGRGTLSFAFSPSPYMSSTVGESK